jgi:hypothetical protein
VSERRIHRIDERIRCTYTCLDMALALSCLLSVTVVLCGRDVPVSSTLCNGNRAVAQA